MSQTVQSESFRGIAAVTVCVWEGGLRGQVTPALLYEVMFCHFVSQAETLRRLDFEVETTPSGSQSAFLERCRSASLG